MTPLIVMLRFQVLLLPLVGLNVTLTATRTVRPCRSSAFCPAVSLGRALTVAASDAMICRRPVARPDPLIVTRLHALPVYLMTAAALVLLVVVLRQQSSRLQRIAAWALVGVIAFQAIIGYAQHFTGLPIGLVILHMLGTGLVVWAMTTAWDRQVSAYRTRPAQLSPAGHHASTA